MISKKGYRAWICRICYICPFLLFSVVSNAQYTYLEGGLGYSGMKISGDILEGSSHHKLSLGIKGTYRPVRFLGIGLEVEVPVIQGGGFGFEDAETSDGEPFFEWKYDLSTSTTRYKPYVYNYEFKQSAIVSISGKFFLETQFNMYLELKVSYLKMQEFFELRQRDQSETYSFGEVYYKAVEGANIDYQATHHLLVPAISFGAMPHITENLFINASAGFNLFNFSEGGFSYEVDYTWNFDEDRHESVVFESQANGTKIGFVAYCGVGYFF